MKISGLEEKKCEALLEEMSRKGLLEYNWENAAHEKQYVLPMYVPGCAEFFKYERKNTGIQPGNGYIFEHNVPFATGENYSICTGGGAGIGMHVIPVEKAIEMENESVDLEHISYWLSKYEGKYAASPCSCRRSRLTHDEGCADDPEDGALQLVICRLCCRDTERRTLYFKRRSTGYFPTGRRKRFCTSDHKH